MMRHMVYVQHRDVLKYGLLTSPTGHHPISGRVLFPELRHCLSRLPVAIGRLCGRRAS